VPQFYIPNIVAWAFLTNHSNALALENDDRRFFVLWSLAQPKPESYYKELHDWLAIGGDAHVVDWLLKRDISRFNPKGHAPDTKAKRDMIATNRNATEAWIVDEIRDQCGIFQRDLIISGEIIHHGQVSAPNALRNTFTPQRVAMALKGAGGEELGQIRIDGRRPHVWAVRRKEMYAGLDEPKLRDLYIKQRDTHSEVKSDFDEQRGAA
jgi:hypothetical protein